MKIRMPRSVSSVTTRAAAQSTPSAPTGAVHTLSTPSCGAIHASVLASGLMRGLMRSGFPKRTRRGMSSAMGSCLPRAAVSSVPPAFCTIGAVAPAPPGPADPAVALPPPGALVIRGGYVLTMDPAAGDLPAADVHLAGGQIAAVGPGLAVPPGTHELDAPGLVDTHWHMWNTLLRSMSADPSGPGYFKVMIGAGRAYGPGDIYASTRLACAEAVTSGITTVHDWCHNVRGPEYAEAAVRALAEAGLRARFSYGVPAGHPNDQTMDTAGLERLHRDWDACSA